MAQSSATSQPSDEASESDVPVVAPQAQTDAVDALLDEIDATLQTNAEQFVRSFVQKGGE